jgi:6-pyruvoyltetrahydropterin/6-carboxytetrahydropterin synthase
MYETPTDGFVYTPGMFLLTREVRFALNADSDEQLSRKPSNSYAGFPSLTGFGHFLTLQVTLAGELDRSSQYLRNIKDIDEVIRRQGIAIVRDSPSEHLPAILLDRLRNSWPGAELHTIKLSLSPFLNISCLASEHPMIRLSQKFEFSAAHRLHNPLLSDEQNQKIFGKCNNPTGHGHNYELQVTLLGQPDANGLLMNVPKFEEIVARTIIDRFDHKNLNVQVAEFHDLIPTVENIARTIFRLLKPPLENPASKLASVTVWETPKTWCEYSE